jgi:hypothetical protein
MKTILQIEIETADTLPVVFENGDNETDYTPEQKAELPVFQQETAEDVHTRFVEHLLRMDFDEEMMEHAIEDLSVDGWESLSDYGTTIKVKQIKK